jgi:hypothetical protein
MKSMSDVQNLKSFLFDQNQKAIFDVMSKRSYENQNNSLQEFSYKELKECLLSVQKNENNESKKLLMMLSSY